MCGRNPSLSQAHLLHLLSSQSAKSRSVGGTEMTVTANSLSLLRTHRCLLNDRESQHQRFILANQYIRSVVKSRALRSLISKSKQVEEKLKLSSSASSSTATTESIITSVSTSFVARTLAKKKSDKLYLEAERVSRELKQYRLEAQAAGVFQSNSQSTPTRVLKNQLFHLFRREIHHRPSRSCIRTRACTPQNPQQPLSYVYSRFRKVKLLNGHLEIPVYCIGFDRSGRFAITGSDDRLVKIWKCLTGELQYTLRGHTGNITDLVVSSDNSLLATSDDDKIIRIWELRTGFPIAILRGHEKEVNQVRFHPNRNILFSASDDGTCRMWQLPTIPQPERACVKTESKSATLDRLVENQAYGLRIEAQYVFRAGSPIKCLDVEPMNGNSVVTGSVDGLVRLWCCHSTSNGEAGVCLKTFHGHERPITNIFYHSTGKCVASAAEEEGVVQIWNTSASSPSHGRIIYALTKDEHDLSMKFPLPRNSSNPNNNPYRNLPTLDMVMWTCNDYRLVTSHSFRTENAMGIQMIKVWDPETGQLCRILRATDREKQNGHVRDAPHIVGHPTNWKILLSAGYDGRVFVWDIDSGLILRKFLNYEKPETIARLIEHAGNDGAMAVPEKYCTIFDAKFSPDGQMFGITDRSGRLILFSCGTSTDLYQYHPSEQYFASDYTPVERDQHDNIIDQETQIPPHLMENQSITDGNRVPYEYQSLQIFAASISTLNSQQQQVLNPLLNQDHYQTYQKLRKRQSCENQQKFLLHPSINSKFENEDPVIYPFPYAAEVIEPSMIVRFSPPGFNLRRGTTASGASSSSSALGPHTSNILQHHVQSSTPSIPTNTIETNVDQTEPNTTNDRDTTIFTIDISSDEDNDEDFIDEAGLQSRERLDPRHSEEENRDSASDSLSSSSESGHSSLSSNGENSNSRNYRRRHVQTRKRRRVSRLTRQNSEPQETTPRTRRSSRVLTNSTASGGRRIRTRLSRQVRNSSSSSSSSCDMSDLEENGISELESDAEDEEMERNNEEEEISATWSKEEIKMNDNLQSRVDMTFDKTWYQLDRPSQHNQFVPQVGDVVVYFDQGYQAYVASLSEAEVAETSFPAISCFALQGKITSIQPVFPTSARPHSKESSSSIELQMQLKWTGKPSSSDSSASSPSWTWEPLTVPLGSIDSGNENQLRWTVRYQNTDLCNFLVLQSHFDSGMRWNYQPSQRIRMCFSSSRSSSFQYYHGQIVDMSSSSEREMNNPWESITVQWDDDNNTSRVSPWEIELENPKARLAHLEHYPASRGSHISAQVYAYLEHACEEIMTTCDAAQDFCAPVNEHQVPLYHITIACPMDLSCIQRRISSRYYRHVASLLVDIELMESNCQLYNEPESRIVEQVGEVAECFRKILQTCQLCFFLDTTTSVSHDDLDAVIQEIHGHSVSRLYSFLYQLHQSFISQDVNQYFVQSSTGMNLHRMVDKLQRYESIDEYLHDLDEIFRQTIDQHSIVSIQYREAVRLKESALEKMKEILRTLSVVGNVVSSSSSSITTSSPLKVVGKGKQKASASACESKIVTLNPTKEDDVRLPFYAFIRELHSIVLEKDDYHVFEQPVSLDIAPDYHDIIHHPMDFQTMSNTLSNYTSAGAYLDDLVLVFENAMTYNTRDCVAYSEAERLLNAIPAIVRELLSRCCGGQEQEIIVGKRDEFDPETRNKKRTPLRSCWQDNIERWLETSFEREKQERRGALVHPSRRLMNEGRRVAGVALSRLMQRCSDEMQTLDPECIFQMPVTREIVDATYFQVITRPMDFQTLDEHIQSRKYRHFSAFLEDLQLIFVNAMNYYSTRSSIFGQAERLYNRLSQEVLPTALANVEERVVDLLLNISSKNSRSGTTGQRRQSKRRRYCASKGHDDSKSLSKEEDFQRTSRPRRTSRGEN